MPMACDSDPSARPRAIGERTRAQLSNPGPMAEPISPAVNTHTVVRPGWV